MGLAKTFQVLPTCSFTLPSLSLSSYIQLVLIERIIYCLRGECYAFKRPGERPPALLRRGRSTNISIPVEPWTPPPPTYAAALASRMHRSSDQLYLSGRGDADRTQRIEEASATLENYPCHSKSLGPQPSFVYLILALITIKI
jgi:hypothetical protein